jgi:hypothetical protein
MFLVRDPDVHKRFKEHQDEPSVGTMATINSEAEHSAVTPRTESKAEDDSGSETPTRQRRPSLHLTDNSRENIYRQRSQHTRIMSNRFPLHDFPDLAADASNDNARLIQQRLLKATSDK